MKIQASRWAKGVALLALVSVVASCGLPRFGPNKREIFSGSVQQEGDAFIVSVNDRVTRATAVVPALGFTSAFLNASPIGSDTIRPGDTLGLTIYENVDSPLLAPPQGGSANFEEIQVDGAGFIFIPYAGRIRASGNTPEAVRRVITDRLAESTPDPQVLVRRLAGDGATVSLSGAVGSPGIFAIERPTRTLSTMLARAGGPAVEPSIARVKVIRGKHVGEIWFEDIFENPKNDIALRAGDRIVIEADTRTFTVLGATGQQSRIRFESQTLTAIEAIAQAGGLSVSSADPTGVFVFRNEPEEITNQVLGRSDLIGPQRMVYVLDLTEPNGLFLARDFIIRDGDTLYVTEAPYAQFTKVITAVTGTLNSANTLTSSVNTLQGTN